jgi:hypothetical protein
MVCSPHATSATGSELRAGRWQIAGIKSALPIRGAMHRMVDAGASDLAFRREAIAWRLECARHHFPLLMLMLLGALPGGAAP